MFIIECCKVLSYSYDSAQHEGGAPSPPSFLLKPRNYLTGEQFFCLRLEERFAQLERSQDTAGDDRLKRGEQVQSGTVVCLSGLDHLELRYIEVEA